MISEEDVYLIKNDLYAMLDYIEKLAIKGIHEETGNEVSIYIMDVSVEMSYSTIKSQNLFLSQFKTFLLNSNISYDEEVYIRASNWILALQRLSTLISVSGEKTRIEFINSQRKIIDSL
jgi:hypothetical protein